MVNNVISTACFSICGYFNYPIMCNSSIIKFIENVSDINRLNFEIELINLPKNEINHSLLFESGDYSTIIVNDLDVMLAENFTPLSIYFRNKFDITSTLIINSIDEKGFEVNYMMEEEGLDNCPNKFSVIEEIAHTFFDTFNPVYGCCGTEMFIDGIDDVEENYIMDSKFYYMGYVDYKVMDKFKFLDYKCNHECFFVESLKKGNLYIRNTNQGTVL